MCVHCGRRGAAVCGLVLAGFCEPIDVGADGTICERVSRVGRFVDIVLVVGGVGARGCEVEVFRGGKIVASKQDFT